MRAAIEAVDAARLVERALNDAALLDQLRSASSVDVVAAGKAAAPMLRGFASAAPVPARSMTGIGPGQPETLPAGAVWYPSAHPVPDERSVAAARRALAVAESVTPRGVLLVLISGGASALMAKPAGDLSLADKRRTSELLLESGADITEMNTVRKHLSAIKGGRLAVAAGGAVVTLAVSDVVGDNLSTIASGPTVPDATTFEKALDVLDRRGGSARYPPAVVRWLARGADGGVEETPKPNDPRLTRSVATVIGGRLTAVDGASRAAEALGYRIHAIEQPVTGEARRAGAALVDVASWASMLRDAQPMCILASGETTVRVTGQGSGGRNQECALAMGLSLETLGSSVVAASVGTDGVDGPTDAAGAVVDTTTLARAKAAGIEEPQRYLDNNDSYTFFNTLGDLIRTGPTGTNVGDLQIILIG